MKKQSGLQFITLFLTGTVFALTLLLGSCSNGFLKDPRLYNPKRTVTQEVAEEPELELTGGVDPFDDTDKWYNKSNSNGDETNPGTEGFDASEFDNIQITGWFSDENVPTYTMKTGDVWGLNDESKKEYVHANAPNTSGQGWNISGVTYYQYRGINPSYAADGNYNKTLQQTSKGNPKLSRFYFYRFTGKGGGVQWLDNNLIAVDTYSKLVFAFSEPVEFSSMGAPTKWSPTDKDPYYNQMYQFYMYDPVGYVLKKEGGTYEVKLYQWFQDSIAAGNYKAKIEGYKDLAKKEPNGAGKSPFNNHTVNFFEENMKLLAGKTFMNREKTATGGNGLTKYIYTISDDGKKLTKKAEVWNGLEATPADVVYTIESGETATDGKVSGGNNDITWFKVVDEGKTLIISNGEIATTTFQDYGPDWIERVKHNPTYQRGNVKYVFSEEGKRLEYISSNGKEYNYDFIQQESSEERHKGVYWTDDASASWMGIGYAGFALYNHDDQIKTTNTSAGGAGLVDWLIMIDEADLQRKKKQDFSSNVGNGKFYFRPTDDNGSSLDLYAWEFTEQGKKVSLTKTPWQKASQTIITNIDVIDNGGDGLKASANEISFTLSEDMKTLTVSSCNEANGNGTFSRSFTDPGPSFLNRVKGTTYSKGNTRYKFSDDGKTLEFTRDAIPFLEALVWMQVKPGTYTYDQGSDKDNVIATYNGYRVHLYQNDSLIKISTVPGVGDASVMEWEANRQ